MRTISRTSLSETCYQLIKTDILTRKLRWGEQLDVVRLAEQFGVSRSPVVQAITRLAHEGFVSIRPQKGSFVVRPSLEDIVEVTQVRVALETFALELAFPRLTEGDLARLDGALRRAEKDGPALNPEAFLESDREFHRLLLSGAHNNRLLQMATIVHNQIELFRLGSFTEQAAGESMQMHRRILEAICRKDLAASQSLLRQHLEQVGRGAVEAFGLFTGERREGTEDSA